MQNSPTPYEIGRLFVEQYYTLLYKAPELLHRFYSDDSTFIHGGVDRVGYVEQPAVGPSSIARRISELKLRNCHAKIRQVDSHPTIGTGIVVQVAGELSIDGSQMRRFMQTFVLAPREAKKYYVQNDIFRYQDEVFEDVSDEDDRSSSPVYGDADKASNPDSSAMASQQSVPATNVNVGSIKQEQQPLPPRRPAAAVGAVNSNQATNETSHRQQELTGAATSSSSYREAPETEKRLPTEQQSSKATTAETTSYAVITKQTPTGTTTAWGVPGASNTVVPSVPVQMAPRPNNSEANANRPTSAANTTPAQGPNQSSYRQGNRQGHWPQRTQTDFRYNNSSSSYSNEQHVFVGSLPSTFTRQDLIECFSKFGTVIEAKLNATLQENKKNFGFVIFEDPQTAATVAKMQHIEYKDARLNVEPKTHKSFSNTYNSQENHRNSYHSGRGGRGNGSGGSRGMHRGGGNYGRRFERTYQHDSATINPPDEHK